MLVHVICIRAKLLILPEIIPATAIFPSLFFNPKRITISFQTRTSANILEG